METADLIYFFLTSTKINVCGNAWSDLKCTSLMCDVREICKSYRSLANLSTQYDPTQSHNLTHTETLDSTLKPILT